MRIQIATLLLGFVLIVPAQATVIPCDVENATANGSFATACAGDTDIGGVNPSYETAYVNLQFQGSGDPFFFVDKTEGASAVAGFVLEVTPALSGDYAYLYTLTVPDEWVGAVVDWVLGVKQANDMFIAYLFPNTTLGIDGGFNNFYLNPGGNPVNDYSHVSGFLRGEPVPAPATLALLGLGALGLGFARRRKQA